MRRSLFVVTSASSYEDYLKKQAEFDKALVFFYKLYGKNLKIEHRSCRRVYKEASFHTRIVMMADILKKSGIVLLDANCLDQEEEDYGCVLLRMVAQDNNIPYATIKPPNIITNYNLPDLADQDKTSEESEEIPCELVEKEEMLKYEWTEKRRRQWTWER